MSRHMC